MLYWRVIVRRPHSVSFLRKLSPAAETIRRERGRGRGGGRRSSRAQNTGQAARYTIPGMAVPRSRGPGPRISSAASGASCHHSRERSFQSGAGAAGSAFLFLLFLMYPLAGGEGGSLIRVPLAVMRRVSLSLTSVASDLGVNSSLAVWGPEGTGPVLGLGFFFFFVGHSMTLVY